MKTPLLQRLTPADRELIIANSTLVPIKKGSFVFMEGDKAEKIFFIKEGTFRVHKQIDDGKEVTVFLRGADDGFGEIGPFSGPTYSCSAHAETNGEVYCIDEDKIESILTNNGAITLEFLRWAAESLETSGSKLKDYMMHQTQGAVASVLIRLTNMYGKETEDGIVIDEPITNYDIASHIGSSRETVNRFINGWRQEGIIEVDRKIITIKDMDYFRDMLKCDKCGVQNCVI